MTKKRLFISALISVAFAMPMGGFAFGFIQAGATNLAGRIYFGVILAIVTPLAFGFPPSAPEDQAPQVNVWSYIIISGLIVFGICTAFAYYKGKPKSLR